MAILTDLPNELLLSIIADVSPLYIESFVLTCKRIYGLSADAITEHAIVRSRFPSGSLPCHDVEFLQCVLQDPRLALYPVHWDIETYFSREDDTLRYLDTAIIIEIESNPYTALLDTSRSAWDAEHLIVPLMITRLLNLRTISIGGSCWQGDLVKTVSQIVKANYDPVLSLRESLPLGRLTEVEIDCLDDGISEMDLAVLLAMIPTLRKLSVVEPNESEPYSCTHQFHYSEITDMSLACCHDSGFLIELIRRTYCLQKFSYTHYVPSTLAKIGSRLVVESLKQHAGDSLLYLSLLTGRIDQHEWHRNHYRNCIDLSLGSLRGFTVLKTLVTCVDMFIKTRCQGKIEPRSGTVLETGTGTVQRLVSWLPASLEILVLHKGLECWDKDTLRLLFRGFRNNKQTRIPNLRFINFVDFPDFDWVMPEDIKNACQETRIKIGYTTHWKEGYPDCFRLYDEASKWEGCGWIELLEECCQCRRKNSINRPLYLEAASLSCASTDSGEGITMTANALSTWMEG